MKQFIFALLVASSWYAFVCPVFAQSIGGTPPSVQYTIFPQTPAPNQSVQLTVSGVGPALGNATLTWQENGATVSSGVGNSSFTLMTGNLGSETRIHLIITSSVLGTITHDFIITPSLTNLVWEAQTTTPLFYRGAPLYSPGALLTVVAFPEVVINKSYVSSKALSFQWSLHGTLVPEQSGLGKNTFTFQGDQLKNSEDVSVSIYLGNTLVGGNSMTIPATTPEILFYDRDPLRGESLDEAFQAINLIGNEFTVQAEPYYFSNTGNLTYQWTLNGSATDGPDAAQGILTLRKTDNTTGTAVVDVNIQNLNADQLLQNASASLQISLGNTTPVTPFGL